MKVWKVTKVMTGTLTKVEVDPREGLKEEPSRHHTHQRDQGEVQVEDDKSLLLHPH